MSARLCALLAGIVLAAGAGLAPAAQITIVPVQGFNDPTPRAPVGGNQGDTVGEQRLIATQFAAALLGSRIKSDVEITVRMKFKPLFCSGGAATLGHAGPTDFFQSFPNAPRPNTWYPVALANAIASTDLNGPAPEIGAAFNSAIDAACLPNFKWYYGLDGDAPPHTLSFLKVVVHELLHGLGFISLTDLNTGQLAPPTGLPDIYTTLIRDLDRNALWPDLTPAQRAASAVNTGRVVWDGASVTTNGVPTLNQGVEGGKVQLYAPSPLEPGSSISHWAERLLPNALMEPRFDFSTSVVDGIGLGTCFLRDIGWTLTTSTQCPDSAAAPPAGPELDVSPQTLDFGAVLVGVTATGTVTVTNTGTAPLQITNVTAPSSPFAILADSCAGSTLQRADDCTITVGFSPSAQGQATGVLGISSNAGTASVALKGIGQPNPAPIIAVTPPDVSFGGVTVGNTSRKTVKVINKGLAVLDIGDIAGLATPFSVTADACSNSAVAPGDSCNFTVAFSPGQTGSFSDSLTVPSNDRDIVVAVSGDGLLAPAADISVAPNALAFGRTAVGSSEQLTVTVRNDGGSVLRVSNVSGLQAPYSVVSDQCSGQDVAAGNRCRIVVAYQPATTGRTSEILHIASNDPDEPTVNLRMSGNATVDTDGDGVPTAVEDNGPNGGDANDDGTPDALQAQVATFKSINGDYVTLRTNVGRLQGVAAVNAPSTVQLPRNFTFNHGFFAFRVVGVGQGGSATVRLTLPEGATPDSYFKFEPGGGVAFDIARRSTTLGNTVLLRLTDGARGDSDHTANGVIVDPGGPGNRVTGGGANDSGGNAGTDFVGDAGFADSSDSGGGCTLGSPGQPGDWGLPLLLALALLTAGIRRRTSRPR